MSTTQFPVPEASIRDCIKGLIEKEGLEKLSSSTIRVHLKNVFGHDFSEFKKNVDKLTQSLIESSHRTEDNCSSSDDEPDETVSKTSKTPDMMIKPSSSHDSDGSDSDQGICSADVPRRAPKRKAEVIPDADQDFEAPGRGTRRAAARNAMSSIKGRFSRGPKKPDQLDSEGKKIAKYGPKTPLVYVSEQLQQITGQQFMRNCDIVSSFWTYVKSNNLLDEKNKTFVVCNELLTEITKKKRFKAFGVLRQISRHIQRRDEMEHELGVECDAELKRRIAHYKEECRLIMINSNDEKKVECGDSEGESNDAQHEEVVSDSD